MGLYVGTAALEEKRHCGWALPRHFRTKKGLAHQGLMAPGFACESYVRGSMAISLMITIVKSTRILRIVKIFQIVQIVQIVRIIKLVRVARFVKVVRAAESVPSIPAPDGLPQ